MASTRTIRKLHQMQMALTVATRKVLRYWGQPNGVTIPAGSVLSIQSGGFWQVISGADSGKLVPMTEAEKAAALAWK